MIIQFWTELPEDIAFWLGRNEKEAQSLLDSAQNYNFDMRYFVFEKGFSIKDAMDKLKELNAAYFKLIMFMAL